MRSARQKFTEKAGNAFKRVFSPMRKYLNKTEDISRQKGHQGLMKCSKCGIYYFAKAWHAARPPETAGMEFIETVCPADMMREKGEYEGSIKINNLPEKYKDELKGLIDNAEKQAYAEDPLRRVLSVEDKGDVMMVYTSENEMAQKIANKIEDAFKHGFAKSEVKGGQGDNTIDVEMDWIKTE